MHPKWFQRIQGVTLQHILIPQVPSDARGLCCLAPKTWQYPWLKMGMWLEWGDSTWLNHPIFGDIWYLWCHGWDDVKPYQLLLFRFHAACYAGSYAGSSWTCTACPCWDFQNLHPIKLTMHPRSCCREEGLKNLSIPVQRFQEAQVLTTKRIEMLYIYVTWCELNVEGRDMLEALRCCPFLTDLGFKLCAAQDVADRRKAWPKVHVNPVCFQLIIPYCLQYEHRQTCQTL